MRRAPANSRFSLLDVAHEGGSKQQDTVCNISRSEQGKGFIEIFCLTPSFEFTLWNLMHGSLRDA